MAADDIYRATFHVEGPGNVATFGWYYQEDALSTAFVGATRSLAESLESHIGAQVLAALSDAYRFTAIEINKVFDLPEPMYLLSTNNAPGGLAGPVLPANNAALFRLAQTKFAKTSNGRIYFPGVAEGVANLGKLTSAFITGPGSNLAAAIVGTVNELAGTGSWIPGIISAKVLNAAPPAKDWESAFAQITSATSWPVIARQRRRTTRAIGASA